MYWSYLCLIFAIFGDVFGTCSLKLSAGLAKPAFLLQALAGYALAFVMLALTLKRLPVGIVYAVWGGLGTVGAALAGAYLFRETYDMPRLVATALIIVGTIVMYAAPKM